MSNFKWISNLSKFKPKYGYDYIVITSHFGEKPYRFFIKNRDYSKVYGYSNKNKYKYYYLDLIKNKIRTNHMLGLSFKNNFTGIKKVRKEFNLIALLEYKQDTTLDEIIFYLKLLLEE